MPGLADGVAAHAAAAPANAIPQAPANRNNQEQRDFMGGILAEVAGKRRGDGGDEAGFHGVLLRRFCQVENEGRGEGMQAKKGEAAEPASWMTVKPGSSRFI